MHDTHLIEKIYESIADICRQNSIIKVVDLHIEVDEAAILPSRSCLSI